MTAWLRTLPGVGAAITQYGEDQDLTAARDKVVAALRKVPKRFDPEGVLDEILSTMQHVEEEQYFDELLNEMYDWADDQKVWIEP